LRHFWTRWSKEYLTSLQARSKWKDNKYPDLKVGSMVVVHDENLPPLRWSLGRIIEVHPGSDNVVRVVTVKTAKGITKRVLTKISVLPIID
ncbi:hypothetical protein NQ314_008931, partial [Rhamnusium bicolor]